MSETLLAILLVTSSAKGSSLVYRWPPLPQSSIRLARPRPQANAVGTHADNPWRAANMVENPPDVSSPSAEHDPSRDDDDYVWRRPAPPRRRSLSRPRSHPTSRRSSPSRDYSLDDSRHAQHDEQYFQVFGYSAEFLAGLLCPHHTMCHQKFELVVDDIAFIGHPVCADIDGSWHFKQDKAKQTSRGRVSKRTQSPHLEEQPFTPEKGTNGKRPQPDTSWLHTFHFVLALDLPDPSSSAAGNISKYFDTIYEQVAFTLTAVLYQEQVLHNFVEAECDVLGSLEFDHVDKGKPFADFMTQALKVSSVAAAMKTLYEAIKDNTIARLTINDFSLELQLPPYLDILLHNDDTLDMDPQDEDEFEFGGVQSWDSDMNFAWRLPALAPWKALLRPDDAGEQGYELYMKLRGPQLASQDRELAEQLMKFLDLASITLCLADMASLLDWDLESQVYPTVRWLVRHRRAKLVDVVHPGLKTVFSVPSTLSAPLASLSEEFAKTFTDPSLPPLPKLLSLITTATYEQTANHFYASVVRSNDRIPLYQDVVIWLLKRDLLETLHLRIRVVATPELKERVRTQRRLIMARRGRLPVTRRDRNGSLASEESARGFDVKNQSPSGAAIGSSPVENWVSMSPKTARRQTRKLSLSPPLGLSRFRTLERSSDRERDGEDSDEDEDEDDVTSSDDGHSTDWDDPRASIIRDPGRATPIQRQWLTSMSEGKNEYIKRRFEKINQYFNGKCTDDEILYRADISRKQLREVLHHYNEYVQTFLHPS